MAIRVIANRYELESEIGRGGMAVVYRDRDLRLNRLVALKLLHPYLATQAESAARFSRESEAIAKLHHPNIVEIFDAGNDEETGSHFLVMELVGGTTLSTFISQHPTQIPEVAAAMLCCLCDAVEHAHKANIIHRDIKPENVMFDREGVLKLMDFGIARILDADRMTASGSLIGSPAHMPPEIIEGQPYTYSCDIFSLGTVFYYTLTQKLPFAGATPMAVFKTILDGNYQAPGRICQTVTKKIDAVVAKCLKTAPSERYQTVSELRSALMEILKTVKMDDYAAVVKQYFSNPDKFYDEHLPMVKSCIHASAQLAIRERRLPLALECLNCILAYDPNDAQAAALLRSLRTGNAMKKRLAVAGCLCGLLTISLFVWQLWTPPTITPHPEPQISTHSDKIDVLTVNTPENTQIVKTHKNTQKNKQNTQIKTNTKSNTTFSETSNVQYSWSEIQNHLWFTATHILTPNEALENAEHPVAIHPSDEQEIKSNTNENAALLMPKSNTQNSGRNTRLRTPKKSITPSITAKNSPETTQNPTTSQDDESLKVEALPQLQPSEQASLVKIIQPVFPPDAYAVINGQRYAANSSGDIELLLAPGNYRMSLTCSRRCVRQTIDFTITADNQNTTREIISLAWADAALNLTGPSDKNLYYVARRLDDRSQRVYHLVPRTPNAISGFNTFGKPIQLEVYAIPTSNTLKSYDATALELAKFASTRVSLSPGDTKSISF